MLGIFYTPRVIGFMFIYSLCYIDPADCGYEKVFSGNGFARSLNTHLYTITEKENYFAFFSTYSMLSSLSTNTTSNGKMFSYNSCGVNVVHFVTVAPHVDTTSPHRVAKISRLIT